MPSKPIIITYNGQKQGELPNTVIKNDLKLPYLERYLIVHVDCDHLDSESRRQLFPTTRESLRDISILEDLRRLVIETLEGDEQLRRLDRDRKQRYMERVESEAVENLRRRLASRISQLIKRGGPGSSPRIPPAKTSDGERHRIPIPVQDPPTFIEITSPNPREVYAGRSFVLHFKTDADPEYFRSPDAFIAIIDPPVFGKYTGTTTVREGYGTTYFQTRSDTEVGCTAEITLELRPKRAKTLRSSVIVSVISLPQDIGIEKGQAPTPNINPKWVTADEPFWQDHEWNEDSVAKVVQEEDAVDIYVSAENRKLNHLIARAQRKDAAVVDTTRDFYLEHISFHAFVADISEQKAREAESTASEAINEADLEKLQERELQRVCETVCGIIDQVFDYLVIGASADKETAA